MYLEILKNYIKNKDQRADMPSGNEGKVSVRLPVHENLINLILTDLFLTTDGLKDFKKIRLSHLNNNAFIVFLDHKRIQKTVHCKIRDVGYNDYSEALIVIDFIGGLRFYERLIIKSILSIQKGWNRIKNQLRDSDKSKSGYNSLFEFSANGLIINLTLIMKQLNAEWLNALIRIKDISTGNDQFMIEFELTL